MKTRTFLPIMTSENLASSLLLRNKFPFFEKKRSNKRDYSRHSHFISAFKIERIFNLSYIDGNKFHAVLIIKRRVVSTVDSRVSQKETWCPLARPSRTKTVLSQ